MEIGINQVIYTIVNWHNLIKYVHECGINNNCLL